MELEIVPVNWLLDNSLLLLNYYYFGIILQNKVKL